MKVTIVKTAVFSILAAILAACSQPKSLDVVGKDSVRAFESVLNAIPENVSTDKANGGWSLVSPDKTARFIWSENYGKSPRYDVMLEFDAAPFIDAGLDIGKLPGNYAAREGALIVGNKLGYDDLQYEGAPTPLSSYEKIVDRYRKAIGYHGSLDHYNVDLGDGNLFEWAKDFAVNGATKENQDKDIVFVLNPKPLMAAGVDPQKVDGWLYAEVTVDIDGKPTQVYKFLKPFNLR
ncbi:MAG: hypothetical protein LBE89_03070 [Helicobacteraceae bacterium]|jgi:hypothetical protein|nr:hypothetical protein [Helicobacteraceae bacterium]